MSEEMVKKLIYVCTVKNGSYGLNLKDLMHRFLFHNSKDRGNKKQAHYNRSLVNGNPNGRNPRRQVKESTNFLVEVVFCTDVQVKEQGVSSTVIITVTVICQHPTLNLSMQNLMIRPGRNPI